MKAQEVGKFFGNLVTETSGIGLYRRSIVPIKARIAAESQEGIHTIDTFFGPKNTSYESWNYVKQQELSMAKTTAGIGAFFHLTMPLLSNVLLEGTTNNIASRSPQEKLGYMGRYFGAAILDFGKLALAPVTGGLSVIAATVAENLIASSVIAARQQRK